MALIAKSAGWQDVQIDAENPSATERQFLITLRAETEADIPDMSLSDIILRRAMLLTRAETD